MPITTGLLAPNTLPVIDVGTREAAEEFLFDYITKGAAVDALGVPSVSFWTGKAAKKANFKTGYAALAHSTPECGRANLEYRNFPAEKLVNLRLCQKCATLEMTSLIDAAIVLRSITLYERVIVGDRAHGENATSAEFELGGLLPRLDAYANSGRELSQVAAVLVERCAVFAADAYANAVAIATIVSHGRRQWYDKSLVYYGFSVPGVDMRLFGSRDATHYSGSNKDQWARWGSNLVSQLATDPVESALRFFADRVTEQAPQDTHCFDAVTLDMSDRANHDSNSSWLNDTWHAHATQACATFASWVTAAANEQVVHVVVSGNPAVLEPWLNLHETISAFHLMAGCLTTPQDGRLEYVGPVAYADFLHSVAGSDITVTVESAGDDMGPDSSTIHAANTFWTPKDTVGMCRYADALEAAELVRG